MYILIYIYIYICEISVWSASLDLGVVSLARFYIICVYG